MSTADTVVVLHQGGPEYESFQYPGGETQVRLRPGILKQICVADEVKMVFRLRSAQDAVELIMLSNAVKGVAESAEMVAILPYLPYSRADRRFAIGDCFGLSAFLKTLRPHIGSIQTLDVHSLAAHGPNSYVYDSPALPYIQQAIREFAMVHNTREICLLFPDEGAQDRYNVPHHVAGIDVVHLYASKKRDPLTGKLLGFEVPEAYQFEGRPVLVVDDICDGGGTFLGIMDALGSTGPQNCGLYVTHGIFSKGFDSLFQRFNFIYTTNSFAKIEERCGLRVFDCIPQLLEK